MKPSKTLLIVVVLAAGLLVLAVAMRGQYGRLTARSLRKQLDTVPDDRAAALLARVAELGDPGIPVLVDALGSQRECLARAAKLTILRQLANWERLRWPRSSQKLSILADALAERVDRFGPTARADAAELAERILMWRVDSGAVDGSRVIASCERVVRAASSTGGQAPAGPWAANGGLSDGPFQTHLVDRAGGPAEGPDTQLRPRLSVADRGHLPGGALPIPLAGPTRPPDATAGPTRPLARPPVMEPDNPLRRPDRGPVFPEGALPHRESRIPSVDRNPRPNGATAVRPLSLVEPAGSFPGDRPADPAEMDTGSLMRQLRAADSWTAGRAQTELVRRGFRPVHLELARRLFDPDVEVRQRLARSLPGMQGVDAVAWLWWLARDASAEVRLAALAVLSTTGDPELLRRVEEISREDPDPRIRRQALRLSGGR